MLKSWFIAILALLVGSHAFAVDPAATPPVTMAKDNFPVGSDTPEGAACDLARAFIHDDAALFLAACVEPYGSPEAKAAYHKFLQDTVVQMKMEIPGSTPAPESPHSIAKCFAARHLSQPGPAAYGRATFGFQDVVFVDVRALLQNGDTQLCRTLVIKNALGKWVVDPQPEQAPLLSAGLDDESPSTQEFSAASPH